jgi:hypothetical protein
MSYDPSFEPNIKPFVSTREFINDVIKVCVQLDRETLIRISKYIPRVEDINAQVPYAISRRRNGPTVLAMVFETVCKARRFHLVHYELVSLLLQYGADPNLQWEGVIVDPETILHLLVDTYRKGSTYLLRYIRLVLVFGADPYQESDYGDTMTLVQRHVPQLLFLFEPIRPVIGGIEIRESERQEESRSRFSNLPRELREIVKSFLTDSE